MKKSLLFGILFLFINITSAQGIAYLKIDTILSVLPGYSKNVIENDSLKKFYTEEIKLDNEKLNNKVNTLFSKYNASESESVEAIVKRFSQSDKTAFELMQKESEMIEQKTASYNQMLNMHYDEKIQPLLDKLNSTVGTYSEKNKFDLVYVLEDVGRQLAYINPKKDITLEIIKLLK